MGTRLLNLRLTPDDESAVERLRARGVSLSEVMRRALRAEAERTPAEPLDTGALLAELQAAFPTPSGKSQARPDTTDRHAVKRHIAKRLRRR